jgi:thioredoxin-like negative regulator of GroEL
MIASGNYHRLWQLSYLTTSAALIALSPLLSTAARAQSLSSFKLAQAQPSPNVEIVNPSLPTGGTYTIQGAQRLMSEAASAVSTQNYNLAAQKLQDARLVMNQLSNFYQSLANSFLGIDNLSSESSRRKALEAAQLRDQATYQLALVYRANSQPERAVPLLVEIIRSQNPTRDLGQKSYQQLLELGFVDTPYPRGGTPVPAPAAPGSAPAPPPAPAPAK